MFVGQMSDNNDDDTMSDSEQLSIGDHLRKYNSQDDEAHIGVVLLVLGSGGRQVSDFKSSRQSLLERRGQKPVQTTSNS